jgi:hypothetical protein
MPTALVELKRNVIFVHFFKSNAVSYDAAYLNNSSNLLHAEKYTKMAASQFKRQSTLKHILASFIGHTLDKIQNQFVLFYRETQNTQTTMKE